MSDLSVRKSGPKRTLIKRAEVPSAMSAVTCRCRAKRGLFYGAAFAHTMTRGLVAATLGQVTVLSLMKVTAVLRGPQYPITSTSFWLHSALHAAARAVETDNSNGVLGPGQQDLRRPEDLADQEVPQDQAVLQDLDRLFHQAAPRRQVRLSAPHHTLMRKWTMQLRLRYL